MKTHRPLIVIAALALASVSSVEAHAQTSKGSEKDKSAASAPATDAKLMEMLVELTEARTLPAGLDASSPELAKIVAAIAAGKQKSAFALLGKYAKANKEHLDEAKARQLAAWIVRRALLLSDKELHAAADRVRFVRRGKLALKKYEASLSGKEATGTAPAFALNAYADGAAPVTMSKKKKKVVAIRKDLQVAMQKLEADDKLGNFELQDLMSRRGAKLQSSVLKKRDDTNNAIISKI